MPVMVIMTTVAIIVKTSRTPTIAVIQTSQSRVSDGVLTVVAIMLVSKIIVCELETDSEGIMISVEEGSRGVVVEGNDSVGMVVEGDVLQGVAVKGDVSGVIVVGDFSSEVVEGSDG